MKSNRKSLLTACLGLALILAGLAVARGASQDAFTYEVTGNGVTITGYADVGSAVSIPETILGQPVTHIGDLAFYERRDLTSLTIPDGVTSIGDNAFSNCSGLTNVSIGNSVMVIGFAAFFGCTSLTSLIIPES